MTRIIITLILLAVMAFPAWGFRFYRLNRELAKERAKSQ